MRCPRADAQKIKNTPPWKITNLKRYAEGGGGGDTKEPENNEPEALASPYMSIITPNINRLNLPIKRHRMTGWIKKKKRLNYMLHTRDSLQLTKAQVKRWKKRFHESGNQKKAGVAIIISDQIDYKPKMVKRDRRSIDNDKGINSSRRCNNYKHMQTQYWSTKIY